MSLQVSVSGFIDVVYIYIHHIPYTIPLIVGYIRFYYIYTGWWLTYPSEKYMTSSVRMMTIPSWMKIMFQTTNQYILPWSSHVYIPWNIIPMFMVQRDDHGIYQPSGYISIVYSLDPIAYFQTVFRSLHLPVDSNCLGIHNSRLKAPLFPSERIYAF